MRYPPPQPQPYASAGPYGHPGAPPPYVVPAPPPYAAPAPAPTPAPAPNAQNPIPTLLGNAITGFGVLVTQLPQMPQTLPPLPAGWPWQPVPAPAPQPPAAPAPSPAPPSSDATPPAWVAFEDEVIARTNQRRAAGAICGGKAFAPAPPVALHPALRHAARGHSHDMAARNYFDHSSPEGTTPAMRAKNAGYTSGFVGENIAAGQPDPARVVQAWVDSPGHCVNLMDPRYKYLGVGYVHEPGDKFSHYWTQNFGG